MRFPILDIYHRFRHHHKGSLSELNTGDAIYGVQHCLDGEKAVFHPNLVDLLDKVFTHRCDESFLSAEQARWLRMYVRQADMIMDDVRRINEDDPCFDPFHKMQKPMRDFDVYLSNIRFKKDREIMEHTRKLTKNVPVNGVVSTTIPYVVGAHNLIYSVNGVLQYSGEQYIELGLIGKSSTTIMTKVPLYTDDLINVRIEPLHNHDHMGRHICPCRN